MNIHELYLSRAASTVDSNECFKSSLQSKRLLHGVRQVRARCFPSFNGGEIERVEHESNH